MAKTETGYSKRPLADKLGIKQGDAIALFNAPRGYLDVLGPLPRDVKVSANNRRRGELNLIQLFSKRRAALEAAFPAAKARLAPKGCLWVSWPKTASGIETDLSENVVRQIGLANHLVDVKVCAVDGTWSGLKFVYRLRDRP